MKKLFALLTAALLSLGLASCGSAPPEPEEPTSLTTEQKREDLEQFCEMVLSTHPDPFFHQSEEEYEARKAELIEKLPGLTDVGFNMELARFAASFGDEHTLVGISTGVYLPVEFTYFEDGVYITAADESAAQWLSYRLVEVGGKTPEEADARFAPYIAHGVIEAVHSYYPLLFHNATLLRYAGITDSAARVPFTLESPEGKTVRVSMDARPESEWEYRGLAAGYEPTRRREDNYFLEEWDDHILYLQYNSCLEQEGYSASQLGGDLAALLAEKPGKREKLVIDMRSNRGGNSEVLMPVLKEIRSYNSGHFSIRVYTLIGNETCSAAVTNSVATKTWLHSKLVGKPSGGIVNLYGNVAVFHLNHSGRAVSVPTKHFDRSTQYEENLTPDVEIPNLFGDYIAGRDACIDYVLSDE